MHTGTAAFLSLNHLPELWLWHAGDVARQQLDYDARVSRPTSLLSKWSPAPLTACQEIGCQLFQDPNVRYTTSISVAPTSGATFCAKAASSTNSGTKSKIWIKDAGRYRTPNMEMTILFLLATAATAMKAPWDLPLLPVEGKELTISRLQRSQNPQPLTPLEITDHVIPLTRRTARSRSSAYARAIQEQAMAAQGDSRLSVCFPL